MKSRTYIYLIGSAENVSEEAELTMIVFVIIVLVKRHPDKSTSKHMLRHLPAFLGFLLRMT